MKISRTRLKEIIKGVMTEESEYQAFFQTALDKAGKSIPSMSDEEKKAFFDKIDAAWNGKGEKNEELVGGQKKLDIDKDGDIGADDLADLRVGKKTNESINEDSGPLKLKGIKINKKSPVTFVLEVSFLIGDEVVISYLTTGTSQDAQKLKSKVEKAFSSGKIVSPSGIGYYAYNESVINEEIKEKDWKTIYNVFVKFLKANTKALEIRVMMRDEAATKKAIESIISGLTNAQRSLKLK